MADFSKYRVNASAASSSNVLDYAGNFLKSTTEGMGELVGISPSVSTAKWRQDFPISSFFSQLAGFGVPYAGWLKASRALKGFDKAVEAVGDLQKAPFMTGAARGALRFAPFEGARVAASQVVGDQPLADMGADAVLSLAIEGGVGGLIQGFASAGTRALPLDKLVPGLDLAAPVQLQTRYIQQIIDNGQLTGDAAAKANYRLNELRKIGRSETLPKGVKYVEQFEGAPKKAAEDINRLFNLDKKGSLGTRVLAQGSQGFKKRADVDAFVDEAGLGTNFEDYVQFPRAVFFRGSRAAKTADIVETSIVKNLEQVSANSFVKREADDGLFVIAKKVTGEIGKSKATDRWTLFKTDDPGRFLPSSQRWANFMLAKGAWVPGAKVAADGGPVYNVATKLMDEVPLRNYTVLNRIPGGIAKAIDKLVPQNTRGESSELVGRVRDALKEYMAPARLQFKNSPRANWIHNIARSAYEMAETQAQKVLYGEVSLDKTKSIFVSMLKGQVKEENETAIKTLVDALSDQEVIEVWQAWRKALDEDALEAAINSGEISTNAGNFVKALRNIDSKVWRDVNQTQAATHNTVKEARQGHMMLAHQWEGDHRILLRGDDNKVVGQASGFNRRAAQQRAVELQRALDEEGISSHIAEAIDASQLENLPKELRPALVTPGFVLERQNVRGFKWDLEPFTKKELMDSLSEAVYGRYRYMANMTVDDLLAADLAKLAQEDPTVWRMLTGRFNDLAGVQSTWGKLQNRATDRILAPMLGRNSATQIVQVSNNIMWHLQLGAMKMSYPIVNGLQFLQTVAPEIAFVAKALPEDLAGTYTHFAAGGTKGPVGIVATPNPLKILAKTFREMRSPDQALLDSFERATRERVIDPRLVEEYVGEQSAKVSDLKSAIGSPGGFVRWLAALSEWAPAQSERFARAQAFTTGHVLGRDFLRLEGDHLFRFAKQFTENTSYLYGTADRPRMFTTPAGSAFGLFKNWMTNYVAAMLEYTGQAYKGNWSPLLWQTAGTLSVGGFAATPLYAAANGFANAFGGNSLLEMSYEMFGERGGDSLNFGLPAALTTASLYSQAATPLANPIRDANLLFSTAHYDRLQHLSKTVGEAWDHWRVTGENPARNSRIRDHMIRALAPTTIYRVMGAVQEEGIKSLGSGLPMVMDATPGQKALYMLGFTPVEMERGLAVAEQLFADRDARLAAVKRLGQAYADAMLEGDSQSMRIVLRQAVVSGVDPSSVLRSAQARADKTEKDILERSFKPKDLDRFKRVLETGQ